MLVLHDKTNQTIESAVQAGTHAVLITGNEGAGKQSIATYIASKHLGVEAAASPYFSMIDIADKAIGIESIRELQKFLQLKTTGSNTIRRVVVLHKADTMTTEAQNALLKILEEPPEDTVIILTASKPHQLRPTIHSRVQTIAILPPPKDLLLGHFMNKGHKGSDIERAYMLSNGQVGLMHALLSNDDESPLTAHISTAKELYGMNSFERLAKVDELSKNKEVIPGILFACKRICITALEQAALKNQEKAVASWHKQLGLILKAEESLKFNPNSKLLLTDLFIQM